MMKIHAMENDLTQPSPAFREALREWVKMFPPDKIPESPEYVEMRKHYERLIRDFLDDKMATE